MRQVYSNYTTEDHQVWQILFDRQMENLQGKATDEYLLSIDRIGFKRDYIPNFDVVNDLLAKLNGWSLHVVPGIIPGKDFFELLANRKFCATTWLRKMSQLDYLEEPDMFHDVFGHIPLLTNQHFCDFYEAIGRIGLKHIDNEAVVELLGRIYWFTVEFGLIQEQAGLRIYGAGILSSFGESKYCLSDEPQKIAFSVEEIINTPYFNDRIQDKYFVIDSFEQLYESVAEIEAQVKKLVLNEKVLE